MQSCRGLFGRSVCELTTLSGFRGAIPTLGLSATVQAVTMPAVKICLQDCGPLEQGAKLKLRGSLKERFKLTATGLVKMFRPGHRHRRFRKTKKQNMALRASKLMHSTYANTLKRMGFKMRNF